MHLVVNVSKEMNKWACVNAKKGTKPKENKNQLAHTEQSDFLFHISNCASQAIFQFLYGIHINFGGDNIFLFWFDLLSYVSVIVCGSFFGGIHK